MNFRAFTKYSLSFLKKDWNISDYPLSYDHQGSSDDDVPEWSVQIVNWFPMCGLGATKTEALRDLEDKLEARRKSRGSLPRPGTKVPLVFASTARVKRHSSTAEALATQVLGIADLDSVFISDESTLIDFCCDETPDELLVKIEAAFGVNVSAVADGNIAEILERIDATY